MVADPSHEFDVFISHASEDKARFVDALDAALRARGLRVWYDSNEIHVGDDFRRKMDEGLARSRFGVVVLSENFFKYWPQAELSALFNQEATFDQTRILPIRLDLDRATLTTRSPLLGGRADLGWELGVDAIAEKIHDRIRVPPPHARPSPIYNAPARRARRLFGREVDLQRLEEILVPGHNVRVAASIEGLAGVGKTELALHIVDRLSETARFPGGIFWLDAENPDLTVAWGSTIADALAVGPGSVEERAAAAVRIASTGEPVLVVLDNVEKWTRESEPRPLPHSRRMALLVTTRHKFLAGPSFEHYALDTLPGDTARQFLFSVACRDLTSSVGIDDLLRHLDGHSLAIELAGAYLHEFPSVTPARYLAQLAEGAPVEEQVQDLVRYEATVRRALDVHWSRLDDTAREALLVAACFAPEDATVALLEACGAAMDSQQPLRRFHLITGDSERWRMHRLVREWARRVAPSRHLMRAKRRFVEGCVEFARRIALEGGFRIYRVDGPHLEQAARDAEEEVLGVGDSRVSVLLHGLGIARQTMGELRHIRDREERALASDLRRRGEDDRVIAIRRSNLALVLQALGEVIRAKDLMEQALASDLKNLGEDHPSVALRRSNLALICKELGDLPRAKDLLESALASDLKNLGDDDPTVATGRFNLALVIQELGDLPRAKHLLERAHSVIKNLGEDHPSVVVIRFILAKLCENLGELARARLLYVQVLSAEERSLGADHPSTAFTRVSLAHVLDELGERARARAEADRALRAVVHQTDDLQFRAQVEQIAARVLRAT